MDVTFVTGSKVEWSTDMQGIAFARLIGGGLESINKVDHFLI